ncbi:hypothetical protein K8Z61_16880 [Nocardioides sp. TRM66260-LWL]|uniref:hypothetical protein n=1 Tax=Nocardioides sp. TRM66260-LWL TaxID=2874478 RepID=UPI001CC6086C|nr:hypothetical protein [Nocardioides sp. TRM66260-LWL]MBZ5736169.1 hypothetical protein [Nocardioides sp. TRM66260-LWL]
MAVLPHEHSADAPVTLRPGTTVGLLLDLVLVGVYLAGALAVARDGERFWPALGAMALAGAAWTVLRAGVVVATSRGRHAQDRRARAARRARLLLAGAIGAGVLATLVATLTGEASLGDGVGWSLVGGLAVLVGVAVASVGLVLVGVVGGLLWSALRGGRSPLAG